MDRSHEARARSLEQDVLWSVLDQDAVPHIIGMARDHWNADAAAAWAVIRQQATLGRLRAYRGQGGPFTPVDLSQVPLDEAMRDFGLFVEPTEATRTRLNEIGEGAATV